MMTENFSKSTTERNRTEEFFKKGIVVFFGAMICCALWGSAFPGVKIGMQLFDISSGQTADQILFAGARFTLAGFLVILFACIQQKKILFPKGVQFKKITVLSLFQTVGQYSFYYVGIAHASGVNTSIVDSLAYFFAILMACLAFRMEKMTTRKTVGCLLGFAGVIIVNISGQGFDFNMSFIGEGMILISAVSYAVSSSLARKYSQGDDPVLLSGYQFMLGGIILMAGSLVAGGKFHAVTGASFGLFVYLAFVSAAAYTLWSVLLKYNDVSKVSIYGFLNPVFGVLFCVIFLNETQAVSVNYFVALVVICVGITLVNMKHKKKLQKE